MRIITKLTIAIDTIKYLRASKEVETEIKEPEPEKIPEPEIHNIGGFEVPLYLDKYGYGRFELRLKDIPDEAQHNDAFWDAYFQFAEDHEIYMVFD